MIEVLREVKGGKPLPTTSLQRKQDEAFRAVSLHRLLTGEAIQNEEVTQQT